MSGTLFIAAPSDLGRNVLLPWLGEFRLAHPRLDVRLAPVHHQPPLAVVDSRLRVRGIAGLRIADASVMPTITSGNTNSPTLMMAEKAAEWIVQDARRA